MMQLSDLLNDIMPVESDVKVKGLSFDSRFTQPGDLFFAYQGTHFDGRKFIDAAIEKGACAIVMDSDEKTMQFRNHTPIISIPHLSSKLGELAARFYHYPAKKLQLIGVTGTNGKTSCSHFIAQILQKLNKQCGVIGTLGNGMYGHIQPGTLTTPDALTLHKLFAEFVGEGAKFAAMEVSSHSLDQGRVNGVEFDAAIFTNLTRDHLDYHGSMEAYGDAKKKLFQQTKWAIINADDEFGRKLIAELPSDNIISYSMVRTSRHPERSEGSPSAVINQTEILASDVQCDHTGIHAKVETPWGNGHLQVPLAGQFNLSNVLAVVGALCALDIPLSDVLDCLKTITPAEGRMQPFGGQDKPLVVVDYSHTPDALEKALIALRHHTDGTLFCVFGCGGDRDRGKRPIMAAIAEKYADRVVVTDDNPRHEDPRQIVADILQGFSDPNKIIVEHDRSKAIRDVIHYAAKGDCILVAGKGAETYQQINDEKIPFSDTEKVKESLFYAGLA